MNERDDVRHGPLDGDADPLADPFTRAIVRLVGDEVLRDPEGLVWRDERFVRWLAKEARAGDRVEARRSDVERLARGRALMRRAQAQRVGVLVRERAGAPADHPGERRAPRFDLGVAAGAGRELWDQAPDGWMEVPDELPEGDYLSLRVAGTSMTPVLHDGDTILLKRGSEVRPESVIVARHPEDGYVCKKVQRVTRRKIELASLEPGRPLIVIPHDTTLILGTVVMVWCAHR